MASAPCPDLIRMDRARVIRRSSRCLSFGLVGAIPLVGVVPAVLAIRLYWRLARDTGEVARLGAVYSGWGVAALYAWVYAWAYGCRGFLAVLAVGACLATAGWIEAFRRAEALAWNPARRRAWWGAALAYTGIAILWLLGELALGMALRSLGPFQSDG